MELIQLSRSEKDFKDLQELNENFYEVAKAQLKQQESELENLPGIERDLAEQAYISDMHALDRLRLIRIRKLVSMAMSDAYREKPKHSLDHMLPPESTFYHHLLLEIQTLRSL